MPVSGRPPRVVLALCNLSNWYSDRATMAFARAFGEGLARAGYGLRSAGRTEADHALLEAYVAAPRTGDAAAAPVQLVPRGAPVVKGARALVCPPDPARGDVGYGPAAWAALVDGADAVVCAGDPWCAVGALGFDRAAVLARAAERNLPVFSVGSAMEHELTTYLRRVTADPGWGASSVEDFEAIAPHGRVPSDGLPEAFVDVVVPRLLTMLSRCGARSAVLMPAELRIVCFAANPADTRRLALDEEVRAIEAALRESTHRDAVRLDVEWAARADDVLRALDARRPAVVHVSAHGTSDGAIVLVDDGGAAMPVGAAQLRRLFALARDHLRLVVLDACFTDAVAEALVAEIDCVVGMRRELPDAHARVFSAAFYRALASGRSVRDAFDRAVVALSLRGGDDATPVLRAREGVDPDAERFFPERTT